MDEEVEKVLEMAETTTAVAGGSGNELALKKRRAAADLNFRLTDRDIKLLGFLLDQKFASLEQLYFRFFDVRKAVKDPLPKNLHVTRQRLSVLRRAGLLTTTRVYSEAKSLYLLSSQGFQVFQSKFPHDAYAMPSKDVDFRSYEHDTKVNDCRVAIERTGKVMKWFSERRLRMQGFESKFSYQKLPKEIVPDGLFVSSKGERIAFEIETTPRKKSRYEDKRDSYHGVMGGQQPLIHRVFWVGGTDRINNDLKAIAGRAQGFVIESYGHFLGKLWPKGSPEKIEASS